MRVLLLVIMVFMTTACAPTQYRTGSVAINKFSIDDYRTNNPMHVKKDVAEHIRDELHSNIVKSIPKDTKLTVSESCETADFELTGRFEEINSKIDSHWRLVTVTVNQLFQVDTDDVKLKRCKTGEVLLDIGPSKQSEDMSSLLDSLADKIVSKIAKEKIPQQ